MNFDAVVWGSAITVVVSTIIVVFLAFKVKGLMDKDAKK